MADGNTTVKPQTTSFANWDDLEKEWVRDGVERVGFRGEDTLLVMNWMQPGMEPGPHSHPFEQIAVIVQGTVRFHVGDETYDAGPGSMIRIPPDVIHWGEVIGDEPAMNLDVFNPIRADYKHLVEHQKGDFGEE
ncbi:MAG: cupin domain-containing protein [Alphaproteobacteria bacterium]|jgi:quercetin dioxygenase-like cupin family protein